LNARHSIAGQMAARENQAEAKAEGRETRN
jgi:hypothetical protein